MTLCAHDLRGGGHSCCSNSDLFSENCRSPPARGRIEQFLRDRVEHVEAGNSCRKVRRNVQCEKVARYVSFGGLDAATRLRQSPRPNATALRGMRLSLKKPVAN